VLTPENALQASTWLMEQAFSAGCLLCECCWGAEDNKEDPPLVYLKRMRGQEPLKK